MEFKISKIGYFYLRIVVSKEYPNRLYIISSKDIFY